MTYNYGCDEFNMDASSVYDFTNKKKSVGIYIAYMLARTQQMFKWNNLPDTIPQRHLELFLQKNGNVCITKVNDKLYAFTGGMGGEPDPYYMPTLYTVANPSLNFNKSLKIGEECIVIPNDSLYLGLLPMFRRYATQLCENDISMNILDIITRIQALLSAPDDRTKAAAEKYLNDIQVGKLGVIGETAFFDGIKVSPFAAHNNDQMTNLIEYHQYLKASWFNDLGLQANYNMKRESINSNEAQLNEDALLPLIDNMLLSRREACDKINAMFGTDISVELSSSWEDNQIEIELEHKALDDKSTENVDNECIAEAISGVVEDEPQSEENSECNSDDSNITSENEEEMKNDGEGAEDDDETDRSLS